MTTYHPTTADLLSRIRDFERTRAYDPRRDYPDEAATAYTRLHWALANLPAVDGDPWLLPMVVVDGVVYAAGASGSVVRGRVVELSDMEAG
jgi:hypothetical protein